MVWANDLSGTINVPDDMTIIGGGIAGLAVATLLARAQRRVTVIESRHTIGETGYGIQMTPNGARILKRLGIFGHGSAISADRIEFCCPRSGQVWHQLMLHGQRHDSSPYLLWHRADLMTQLVEQAKISGVNLRLDTHVVKVEDNGHRVACTLASGDVIPAEYLIGCDGLTSPVRQMLNPHSLPLYRHHAWRSLVAIPSSQRVHENVIRVLTGPGGHVVTYPLRSGSVLNIVAIKEAGRAVRRDPGMCCISTDRVLREFDSFGHHVRDLLQQCEPLEYWPIVGSSVAKKWSGRRSTLIGDALHAMPPFLAQGGNMALEDAWTLSQSLISNTDIAEAHRQFRLKREPRIRKVLDHVELQGRLYHARGLATPARQAVLCSLNRLAPGLLRKRLAWLFDWDECATAVGTNSRPVDRS